MTLTDTRKALQEILEEATATDYAVCYVTDADEETLRSAIQAIDDVKKMQGMLKTAVDEIEKLMKDLCHATTPDSNIRLVQTAHTTDAVWTEKTM